jgi:hypothetical protein
MTTEELARTADEAIRKARELREERDAVRLELFSTLSEMRAQRAQLRLYMAERRCKLEAAWPL